MFAKTNNIQQPTNSNMNVNNGSSRRAFRDVSNVGRTTNAGGKGGKAAVATKRANGIKTRSMASTNEVVIAPRTNQQNNSLVAGEFAEGRDPAEHDVKKNYARIIADPTSYQVTGNTDNIDDRDRDDPLCATAYVQEMYEHFRIKEVTTSVRPIYMERQPHINERMRAILVDWLVEVHLKFKLVPETLYLTVNLIDRYLEIEQVSRPKLQLVGVTSLLIASKYEEIYPPELRDLVYICDRAYTRADILEMEEHILKTLHYNITIPSAHAFLVRFLKAGHADKRIVQLSCYILDGTLQSYHLMTYLPSQLAAAAVFISRRVVGRNSWSPTLLEYSDYCEEEIISVARTIMKEREKVNPELKAVNKKYSTTRYGQVAQATFTVDF